MEEVQSNEEVRGGDLVDSAAFNPLHRSATHLPMLLVRSDLRHLRHLHHTLQTLWASSEQLATWIQITAGATQGCFTLSQSSMIV